MMQKLCKNNEWLTILLLDHGFGTFIKSSVITDFYIFIFLPLIKDTNDSACDMLNNLYIFPCVLKGDSLAPPISTLSITEHREDVFIIEIKVGFPCGSISIS